MVTLFRHCIEIGGVPGLRAKGQMRAANSSLTIPDCPRQPRALGGTRQLRGSRRLSSVAGTKELQARKQGYRPAPRSGELFREATLCRDDSSPRKRVADIQRQARANARLRRNLPLK